MDEKHISVSPRGSPQLVHAHGAEVTVERERERACVYLRKCDAGCD